MPTLIEIRTDGPVARITLNDPATRNSLGLQMARDLRLAFEQLADDDQVRAVLLEGNGGNFSAGGNLREALACATAGPRDSVRFMAGFNALLRSAFYFPKPLIGVVRGAAAGGAVGLLLCTDIILVGPSARLMQAFIHVALAPDCGTSILLARRVGIGRAKELTLTGREVDGEEACRIGLADALHAEDALEGRALELARSIALKAPLAATHAKRLMQHAQFGTFDEALEMEGLAQAVLLQSADFKEGAAAFLEKRRPAFKGK